MYSNLSPEEEKEIQDRLKKELLDMSFEDNDNNNNSIMQKSIMEDDYRDFIIQAGQKELQYRKQMLEHDQKQMDQLKQQIKERDNELFQEYEQKQIGLEKLINNEPGYLRQQQKILDREENQYLKMSQKLDQSINFEENEEKNQSKDQKYLEEEQKDELDKDLQQKFKILREKMQQQQQEKSQIQNSQQIQKLQKNELDQNDISVISNQMEQSFLSVNSINNNASQLYKKQKIKENNTLKIKDNYDEQNSNLNQNNEESAYNAILENKSVAQQNYRKIVKPLLKKELEDKNQQILKKQQEKEEKIYQDMLRKKEQMVQERELLLMEQEDFLSMEVEEFNHKELFYKKDINLPKNFQQKLEQNIENQIDLKGILCPNIQIINYQKNIQVVNEENMAPKNSKEVPKLLNTFYDDAELNVFYDDFEENSNKNKDSRNYTDQTQIQSKSLKLFLEDDFLVDYGKTSKLQLKLENITDINGIEKLKKLQILTLSVNKISQLDPIIQCQNLVEVNLGQNNIVNYQALGELQELRLLNLELNQIQEVQSLFGCKNLQILNLNNNKIREIKNLEKNQTLKRISFFKNQIEIIDGLENLLLLEELDLGCNRIRVLEGIKNNLLLKKLLIDITNIFFLPCLEYLNLSNNKIQKCGDSDLFNALPSLEYLNISYNNINNFSELWNLVRFSQKLKILNYQQNNFLLGSSENIVDMYEFLFLQKMKQVEEINTKKNDLGLKKFLEIKFQYIMKNNNQYNSQKGALYHINQKNLQQTVILESQKIQQNNKLENKPEKLKLRQLQYRGLVLRFLFITRENYFFNRVENSKMGNQKCIFNQTWRYFQLRNFATCRHLQGFNEQKFQDVKVYNYPIQYEYDSFFNKQLKSNKKIKNSLIFWIYKRKQRRKFYNKHEKQVIIIQAFFRGQIIRKMTNLRPILDRIRFNSKAKYAIRIQRKWRQFVLKKKRQRLFKNLKYEDDDELEDIDMDWINQEPEFDSGLQIPENFDVEAFITPSHLLEQAKQIPSKAYQSGYKNDQMGIKMGQINEEIEEEQKSQIQSQNKNQFQKFQKNSSDIFVESFSSAQGFNYKQQSLQGQNVFQNQGKRISEQEFEKIYQKMQDEKRKIKVTDEEEGQIMNDWGFKDPKVAKAMAQKIEKMRKLKYQKQQKNLTAEQKLAKFRAANKK